MQVPGRELSLSGIGRLKGMMDMENYCFFETPVGMITIAADETGITRISFGQTDIPGKNEASPLTDLAYRQMCEYFEGRRKEFDLPLSPAGTPFQQAVWRELMKIPYGETRSYSDIAAGAGNPKACRAVGMANNKNPIAIVIPCHRVVGKSGSLTGYAGGLEVKQLLLDLERQNKKNVLIIQ